MGCHDLGEFVRYYPRGRQVIDKISAKQTVMQLMSHDVSIYNIHIFYSFHQNLGPNGALQRPYCRSKNDGQQLGDFGTPNICQLK